MGAVNKILKNKVAIGNFHNRILNSYMILILVESHKIQLKCAVNYGTKRDMHYVSWMRNMEKVIFLIGVYLFFLPFL